MTVHAFVDETKRNGLVLACVRVAPRDLARTRAILRRLCLPGQHRVHFSSEGRRRRCEIAGAICSTGVVIDFYDASAISDQRRARAMCLRQIVLDLALAGGHRLVIEQDDSALADDKRVLFLAVHEAGAQDVMTYEHVRPRSEELLWIADAAAWCWTHGRPWTDRIRPVVGTTWRA
jgi:hypothetical protein